MSMPIIPDRTQEQAFTDLLVSIALEETGLAHMINAEGEKIQAIVAGMLNGTYTANNAIDLQKSVVKVMQTIIKKEMLLQFKLEEVIEAKEMFELPPTPTPQV